MYQDKIIAAKPDAELAYFEAVALFERLHRLLLDIIKDEFERLNITELNSVQALLLYNISDSEVSAKELRTRGYYHGSNASYNLKKMVSLGYVNHQPCEFDKRSIRIKLTKKGLKIRDTVRDLIARHAKELEKTEMFSAERMWDLVTSLRHVERFCAEQIRYYY